MSTSHAPAASSCDTDATNVAEPDAGGGMKVPEGIEALTAVVPSSIPPEMFEEAPPSAPMPKRAIVKPPSVRKMAAVKPPSLPGMPAAKPPPLPKAALGKAPSSRKIEAALPVAPPDPHGAVTVQMPVAMLPQEPIAITEPAAVVTHGNPSSFPSSGKMLVFEVTSLEAPLPPSSVGGIVVTPAHERLAGPEEEDEIEDLTSRTSATVVIPGLRRRRWSRVIPSSAAGVALAILCARLVYPTPTHHGVVAAAAQPAPQPAPPPEPAPLIAAATTATATPPPAPPAPVAAPEPAPTTGMLSTSTATPGRRIFVDERAIGETPAALPVPCGVHRVRVGSRGKTLSIDVPCGAEVSVSDR